MVEGHGAPGGTDFQAAMSTLFAVAYAAHFVVREQCAVSTPIMPPEAAYWTEGEESPALGAAPFEDWHWALMLMQPEPIDATTIESAVGHARRRGVLGLDRVRYERWQEGPALQTVHVGPYESEGPTLELLSEAMREAGLRPHGRHHEIYLSDPRRTAPERIRTILRQPVTPATEGKVAS